MYKTVSIGQYLNKGAEFNDLPYLSKVYLTYFNFFCYPAYYFNCLVCRLFILRSNGNKAGIVYVYLNTGLLDYPLYNLTSRPDNLSYFGWINLHSEYPRCMFGQCGPRCRYGLKHLIQYVEPASPCLFKGLRHYLMINACNLYVHLYGSCPVNCSCNFERHITEMVLKTEY